MPIYCDDVVPAYAQDCCANEPGRIIAIAYIRTDSLLDPSTYTSVGTWTSEIAAGRAFVIKCVRGSKPPSTANDIDGYGRQATRSVSRNFTANYRHADVIDNIDFYNVMNFSTSFKVAMYTPGGIAFIEETNTVNIDADYEIVEGLDSIIDWNVNLTWINTLMPLSFDVPDTIFEENT